MAADRKRRPVRTETCDEDDTLRLAHLVKSIQRRTGYYWRAFMLVERAFAFNGTCVLVKEAEKSVKP